MLLTIFHYDKRLALDQTEFPSHYILSTRNGLFKLKPTGRPGYSLNRFLTSEWRVHYVNVFHHTWPTPRIPSDSSQMMSCVIHNKYTSFKALSVSLLWRLYRRFARYINVILLRMTMFYILHGIFSKFLLNTIRFNENPCGLLKYIRK